MTSPISCETISCDGPVVAVIFWPGQTLRMCGQCAARALRIAGHMGFDLATADLLSPADLLSLPPTNHHARCVLPTVDLPPCAICLADRDEPCKGEIGTHPYRGRSREEIDKFIRAAKDRTATDDALDADYARFNNGAKA